MTATVKPSLSLGPVSYLWDEDRWRDFYFRIADEAPLSHVTVGETVCSKRLHFTEPHLSEVIERLERGGKAVHIASLGIVTLEREIRHTRSLALAGGFIVEANDLSALHLLKGKRHAVGPLVNVYNAPTAQLLASHGALSICLPPELPLASIAAIAAAVRDIDVEVFAFGRMPLAISARCAHARSKGLIKDNCQFVCGEDPDGLEVRTLAHQPFLTINGVQTLSHTCQALLCELDALAAAGVSRFRLSPQTCDMVAVAQVFDDVLAGRCEADEGLARIGRLYPGVPLSNGFLHAEAGAAWISKTRSLQMEG